ncbi:hypothetical protein [Exiguobacterium undae]|uniref:hypothetical protein n=1 Tax=Exiguobacterium undae TaxID=169177 RepID=UPI00384C4C38
MAKRFYDSDSIKMNIYTFEIGDYVEEKEVLQILNDKSRISENERYVINAYFEYSVDNPEDSNYEYSLINFSFTTFLDDREVQKEENDEFDEKSIIFRSQTQYKVEFTEPILEENIEEITSKKFRRLMVKDTISKFKVVFNMSLSQTHFEELSITDNVIEGMINRHKDDDQVDAKD